MNCVAEAEVSMLKDVVGEKQVIHKVKDELERLGVIAKGHKVY